jgi:hypothetical protein
MATKQTSLFNPGKATDIKDVMPIFRENFSQKADPIRRQADRLFNHTVSVEKMMEDGAQVSADFGDLMINISQSMLITQEDVLLMGKFGQVKTAAKKLFDSSFFADKEFGHDFSIVAIRLGVFAQVLQDLEDNMVKAGAGPRSKVRAGGEIQDLFENKKNRRNTTTKNQTDFAQKATLAGLKKIKKRIQTMFMGARRLDRISPFKGSVKDKYTVLADSLNEIDDFQLELTAEKEKLFDISTGKADLSLTVVQKNKNKFDSILESGFGRNMSKEFTTGTENNMKDYFLNKVDIGDIKGGPETLNNKVTKDLGILLGGGKPKKIQSSSKTTVRNKFIPKKHKKSNIRGSAARAKAGADFAKKALAIATIKRRTDKKESGNPSEFKQLAELRTKIQARLPAEVRRNMGGTALTNRTSRFSNSVHLTKLLNTPKGIVGDYSYMLSPYETFENTGARKWKTGYNPKPLIAKSIRKLAFEIAGARFIKGRRT